MKQFFLSFFIIFTFNQINAQLSNHIVLISIDGLRPEMYQDKSWPTPNLQQLMKEGFYADHMKSVFPSYTYPSHTAMLTGALPARSGIVHNVKNDKGEWYWFTKDIKVPTLWQAIKQNHQTSAAIEWPVSVDENITYDIPEIWDPQHPFDRITEARKYANPDLMDEIEKNATGKLDSNNMRDEYLSLDENAGRIAAYIFKTYKPNLLCVHFAEVDDMEHKFGREGDSVNLAVANADHAIGDIIEAINRAGMKDSTTIIIVGDHGFSDIHTVIRPNVLIKDLNVKFKSAGGSAFLYPTSPTQNEENKKAITEVRKRLDQLPAEIRKRFRMIDRKELDKMGADSSAIFALAAVPGTVFSGAAPVNVGPGTNIQQNNLDAIVGTTKGGHHGYDPNLPEMYTGFIAEGAGIGQGQKINELCVTDIAPLIAKLLGLNFKAPDGKLVEGILR